MEKEELVGLNLAVKRDTRTSFKTLAVLKGKSMPEMFEEMLELYIKSTKGNV